MLPNEIPLTNSWILRLAWGFLWRYLLLVIPASFISAARRTDPDVAVHGLLLLLQFAWLLVAAFFATKWLYRSFGSVKVTLMERADYERLVTTTRTAGHETGTDD